MYTFEGDIDSCFLLEWPRLFHPCILCHLRLDSLSCKDNTWNMVRLPMQNRKIQNQFEIFVNFIQKLCFSIFFWEQYILYCVL